MGQSFVACQTGELQRIGVITSDSTPNQTLSIYAGDGIGGTLIDSTVVSLVANAPSYSEIDLRSLNIELTAGNFYTFYFTPSVSRLQLETDGSFAGSLYANGVESPSQDLLFFAEIAEPNQPPFAQDDGFTSFEDEVITGNLFVDNGNGPDFDPDGDPIEVNLPGSFTANGIGGDVTIEANGDFTYTPPLNVSGEATFDYFIVDPSGASDIAVVGIQVSPINDQPSFIII